VIKKQLKICDECQQWKAFTPPQFGGCKELKKSTKWSYCCGKFTPKPEDKDKT
jgi:hypothetical protein